MDIASVKGFDNSEIEKLYYLWLSIACDHNPKRVNSCIERFGGAKELYLSRLKDDDDKEFVTKILKRIPGREFFDVGEAVKLYEKCRDKDISILTVGDEDYPQLLKNISTPPAVLYVRGALPNLNRCVTLSVVGTRGSTDYFRKFALATASRLAKTGVVIVSGMAMGIDTFAHLGALWAGHKTIAVLAGGVDVIYPSANADLYNEIIKNGAVISERPPGFKGRAYHYRERNRIIAGLSHGTMVVEAPERSGAIMTANWALEYDRDVFSVPGRPTDTGSVYTNVLIKDGATPVTSAEDILEGYVYEYPTELEYGISLLDKQRVNREFIIYKCASYADADAESSENAKSIAAQYVKNNSKNPEKDETKSKRIQSKGNEKKIYSEKDVKININNKTDNKVSAKKQDVDLRLDGLSELGAKIVKYIFEHGDNIHIDQIADDLGVQAREANCEAAVLVMSGKLVQRAGNLYSIKEED